MLIIAHRGSSDQYPENSALAIKQAIAEQADGIEIDIQYHQPSKQFIVFHDHDLQRLTGLSGQLADYSIDDIKKMPLGQNQTIITLADVFPLLSGSKVTLNIELKMVTNCSITLSTQLQQLATMLSRAAEQGQIDKKQVLLSSFNHQAIAMCQKIMPQFSRAAIIAHSPLDYGQFATPLNVVAVVQSIESLNEDLIKDLHQRNLACWVYTVDLPSEIAYCQQLGVDAIFTNRPSNSRQSLRPL